MTPNEEWKATAKIPEKERRLGQTCDDVRSKSEMVEESRLVNDKTTLHNIIPLSEPREWSRGVIIRDCLSSEI